MQLLTNEQINAKFKDGCFVKMEKNISLKIARDCGLQCVGLYNIILMHKHSNNPHGCYPTYETLMTECNIKSKVTFLSYLSKLEEYGYIKIKSGNRCSSNMYYFPLADVNITNYSQEDLEYINNVHRKKGIKKSNETTYHTEEPF